MVACVPVEVFGNEHAHFGLESHRLFERGSCLS